MTNLNLAEKGPFTTAVFDVDGTLLNSNHQLPTGTKEGIRQLVTKGVEVMIATGKTFTSTLQIRKELKLTGIGVYTQGLYVCDADGIPKQETFLDKGVVAEVLDLSNRFGIELVAYAGLKLITTEVTPVTDQMLNYHEPRPEAVGDMLAEPINKFLLLAKQSLLDQIRPELEARWQGQAALVQAVEDMLEVVPIHTSKGGTLARVLNGMGRTAETTVAFGDGENDIEMLRWAGLGIAMGNAKPQAKAAANFVTHSNDDGGIAHALAQLDFRPQIAK